MSARRFAIGFVLALFAVGVVSARQNGLVYGLVTTVMALMTGWMASIVFGGIDSRYCEEPRRRTNPDFSRGSGLLRVRSQ